MKQKIVNKIISSLLSFILVFQIVLTSFAQNVQAAMQIENPLVPQSGRIEVKSKRTINSKTYLNSNGSYTTEIFAGPIHYQKKSNQENNLEDVNNNLSAS